MNCFKCGKKLDAGEVCTCGFNLFKHSVFLLPQPPIPQAFAPNDAGPLDFSKLKIGVYRFA